MLDPACFDYNLYNKAHIYISIITPHPLQKTSPTSDPVAFFQTSMDTVSHLIHLCQGDRPIEDNVAEFCELCDQVGFNDIAP